MKKTLIILYGFLFLFFIGMHAINGKNTYSAERKLWHLTRQYGAIVKNYEGTPASKYDQLHEKFDTFINKYSPHRIAAAAHVMRARLYTIQEKDAEAKQEISRGLNTYQKEEPIYIQLLLEQAQMYAIRENIQGVADIYKIIISEYPLSRYGMQGPLTIAKYFVEKRDAGRAKQAYADAIDHYKKLIEQHPESQIEFQSRILLAECYTSLEDWGKALDIYQESLLKFANPEFWNKYSFLHVTQSINSLTILREKDYATPANLYSTFIEKYPDHPFNRDLGLMVTMIRELEAQQKKRETQADEKKIIEEILMPDLKK